MHVMSTETRPVTARPVKERDETATVLRLAAAASPSRRADAARQGSSSRARMLRTLTRRNLS
jgi:hypothetical protein